MSSQRDKPWIIKYLPTSTSGVIGREKETAILKRFVESYKQSRQRSLLLCGPCGSGKTSFVTALAQEMNFELLEINASDARNKDQMQKIILPAVTQKSFFYEGKIVLIDEIDGLSGMKDRGGASELAKIIDKSHVPIILTANDVQTDKLKAILKKSLVVPFEKLPASTIKKILLTIVAKEKLIVDEKIIQTLAIHSDGDCRAAINDLQLIATNSSSSEITESDLAIITERKRTRTIEEALQTIFKSTDAELAREALYQIDEDIDAQFMWIDHNLGREYTKSKDLARAYGALSKADVFKGRIRRNQSWNLLPYVSTLLGPGVATAKDAPYPKPALYQRSTRPLKIWQMNMSNAKRNVIAAKLAEATHCSTRVAFSQIDYFRLIFKRNASAAVAIATELDLSDDEVKWMKS